MFKLILSKTSLCSLSILSFILTACETAPKTQADLQTAIDAAVQSNDKTVELSGNYFIDSPIKLSVRHSGINIKGDNASINGGKKIDGWIREGKFLKANVDAENVDALFVNGKRAQPAESEEMIYMYSYADKNFKYNNSPLKSPENQAFKVRNEDIKFFDGLSQKEIRNSTLDVYTVWYQLKLPVIDIVKNDDGKTSTVVVENNTRVGFFKWETAPRFKVKNAFKALDKQGEFYFDKVSKNLFYFPLDGENENNIEAFYPTLTTILSIEGDSPEQAVSDIKIENVKFQYGNIKYYKAYVPALQAAATEPAFLDLQYARNIKINNCQITHADGYAISLNSGTQNCEISDCVINDIGCGGIRITDRKSLSNDFDSANKSDIKNENLLTKNIKIKNNIICAYGRYNKAGVGVFVQNCGDVEILHNSIFDGYYSGVSIGWTWGFNPTQTKNMKVCDNKIFNIGHGMLCDMGGIYTLGMCPNSEISGNEIYGVRRHRYGGWGIYNDEGSMYWVIKNNYVHDTQEDCYYMHYGEDCTVTNNVFVGGKVSQVGIGTRMFLGFKPEQLKRYGKVKLQNGYEFKNNIVKYSSPAEIYRKGKKIPRNIAKFDSNIYWNDNGDVVFSGLSFDQWKKDFSQDKNSIIEDPKLQGAIPSNKAACEKIGFIPFDISKAGVEGVMKDKLNSILKNYQFPKTANYPAAAPWKKQIKKTGTFDNP